MNTFLLFGSIGWAEVLIIAFVVLLLFGGRKIPELMKGLGKGIRNFKEGMKDVENEVKNIEDDVKNIDSDQKK